MAREELKHRRPKTARENEPKKHRDGKRTTSQPTRLRLLVETSRLLARNYALGRRVALLLSGEDTNSVDGNLDERFIVAVIADAFVGLVLHGVVGGNVVPAPMVGTVGVRAVQDIAMKENGVARIEFEIHKGKTRDSRFDVLGISHRLFIDAIVIDAANYV